MKNAGDSDNLPLSVSRKTLQPYKVLEVIKKELAEEVERMKETLFLTKADNEVGESSTVAMSLSRS